MISNKFELSVFLGIFVGWVQLVCGHKDHAFYSLGILVVIILLGILNYLKEIYIKPK